MNPLIVYILLVCSEPSGLLFDKYYVERDGIEWAYSKLHKSKIEYKEIAIELAPITGAICV